MSFLKGLRRRVKYFFRLRVPPFQGLFWYHHTYCYFPPNSMVVRRFFDDGCYEPEIIDLALLLARDDTWVFDVGAHLGMISIPLLANRAKLRVAAFEPSPGVLPYLRKTHTQARFNDRWELITSAVGAQPGEINFYLHAPQDSAYDGIADTGRAGQTQSVRVPVTTLDLEWTRLNRPAVSLIKMDVEGGELAALQGAAECLAANAPALLLEWNHTNLHAHHLAPHTLLDWAAKNGYRVFDAQLLLPIDDTETLELRMHRSDNFLLTKRRSA